MNPPNTHHGSTVVDLAAGGAGIGVAAFVVGLVVVIVLIGAFWWGARLRARQTAPPRPSEQPHRPARPTRAEGSVPPSDEFPDDGQRLTPHQLGGHGNEVLRPSDGTENRRGSGPGETPDTPEGSPRA